MRNIIITPTSIEAMCDLLRKQMLGSHVLEDTIKLSLPTKVTLKPEEKPVVIVSETAQAKMKALVDRCPDEIAWHGTVTRDIETNSYRIEDIFVFPQVVTGTTATGEDGAYEMWVATQPNEIFDHLRFHGHSHVNMGVIPSAVDLNYQEALTDTVRDFYIFAIYNKKEDFNIWIYDKEHNLLYEKADICYDTEIPPYTVWAHNQIAQHVKKKTYAATTTTTTNIQTNNYIQDDYWTPYTGHFVD